MIKITFLYKGQEFIPEHPGYRRIKDTVEKLPDGILLSVYDLAERLNMTARTLLQYTYKFADLKEYRVRVKGLIFFGNKRTIQELNRQREKGEKRNGRRKVDEK